MKQIKNILFLVGNNGCGKNTILNDFLKNVPNSKFMISYTDRGLRLGEEDKKDYYFVTTEYLESIKSNLMEYITFGNYSYGYHEDEILNNIEDNNHLIFIIEPNGIKQILEWFKNIIYSFSKKEKYTFLEKYTLRFEIMNIVTKKSIRLKRLLKDTIETNDSYEEDSKKVEALIDRLLRNGDSIDELLESYKDEYIKTIGKSLIFSTFENNDVIYSMSDLYKIHIDSMLKINKFNNLISVGEDYNKIVELLK